MMFSVFGTGMVGEAIGTKLVSLGHDVCMGARSASSEKAAAWQKKNGDRAKVGTFSDAAAFGEIVFCCLKGDGAVAALTPLSTSLTGKILVDVTNPLDFSKGMPPSLSVVNTDSLGEQIQAALTYTRVVKALNTVTAALMVAPEKLAHGDHTLLMCGNDADAKGQVREICGTWFGWKDIVDLGDITNARGTEMYLALWLRLYGVLGTPGFNLKVVR